ncbi:MAG: hypothetical protein ACXVBG_21405 [Isosphaeraceae bacterium]|jgi:hypothetical protein
MSQEDVSRIEAALVGYFLDAKAALAAALSEVRNAALPGAAQAVRAEFGDWLTVPQAVLMMAIKRGELWLPFNPARGGISKKIQKP